MNGKYRILLVGCGVISVHWFEYTLGRGDCEFVGVVDVRKDAAEQAVKRYGLSCPVYTDLDEALKSTAPDIVYDLSFVTTHLEVSTKAMASGAHVFSEKPMTTDRESSKALLRCAREYDRHYFIMQNRRYQKPMQALRELIASGRLGKLWTVCADIFVPADLKSIRNQLQNPMLQDNAIHTFDGARFITGAEPVCVYCKSYNPEDSKYKGDAAGVCLFDLSDGSVFVYNCVMGVEGCHTSWESSWRVIGSKGSAVWDGSEKMPYAEVVSGRSGEETLYDRFSVQTEWEGQPQHFGCLDEMFAALIAGQKSQTDCADNARSMAMVFASLESAKSGKPVSIAL